MSEQGGRMASGESAIGIGLRGPHFAHIESARPALGWLEVHAENFMDGGPLLTRLLNLRPHYEVSLHGVGLSLGTAEGLDPDHLRQFKTLIENTNPFLVSDHLSWSIADGVYLNDLLPLPYTEETLAIVARNVDRAQNVFGRKILIENPSRYLSFRHSTIPEAEFLAELTRRAGCGILCDVNNIYVTCTNLGLDPDLYLATLPSSTVGEIHLAGHSRVMRGRASILIDDHASPVIEPVWQLYERALKRFSLVPSLIEWDKNIPPFETLVSEAEKARIIANNLVMADARAA